MKVTFRNSKGFRLFAEVIGVRGVRGVRKNKQPLILFAHGLNSSRSSPRNTYVADGLVGKGFACMLLDFTGHGESEGTAGDVTVEQFASDMDAALNHIGGMDGIDRKRVGIVGSSMGGTAALLAAAKEGKTGRIAAMVLRSSPSEGYHEYAGKVAIPVLIVQGDADPIMRESIVLYEKLGGEKKLYVVKGADHLFSREEHLKEAREKIVEWFTGMFLNTENPGIRVFKDRRSAGGELAKKLSEYKNREGVLVLALPRGGVVTGKEVADYLGCPLDVVIVRKLGFPGQPELAIGALSESGTVFLNNDVISSGGVSKEYIEKEITLNRIEIERRVSLYRKGKKLPPLKDKTIILVDDGVATGATIKSAIAAIRAEHPMELVVALPVSPPQTAMELKKIADKLVCLMTPDDFFAVGAHYGDFRQITDEEVVRLLAGEQEKSH